MNSKVLRETIYGYVPIEWEMKKIIEYSEIVTDYIANGSFASLKQNVQYKEEPDIAVLLRLVDYRNNFEGDFVYINEHSYDFLKKSKLFGDEIIISNVGANVGTAFKCPKLKYKMSLAPNAIMMRTHGYDDFYYYWLISLYGQFALKSIVSGSAQPKFNKTDFRNIIIPVPPIGEQKSIASTLSCLDDKIELNNRINKNLEEITQVIFKSWFLDFEPFQDGEFEDSELGRIPTGWRVESIEEISKNIVCGKTPSTKNKDNYGNLMPFITIPDMHGNIYVVKTERYLSSKGINTQSNKTLPKESVVISCIATPGLVILTSEESQTNQQINSIICKDNISPYYIFLYMKIYSDKIKNLGSGGSTTLNLNKTQFSKIKLIVPTDRVISEFNTLVEPLFKKILENQKQTDNLTNIRDSLLPKLMCGEIRVPVEEVQ